jgi:hypothetical protein
MAGRESVSLPGDAEAPLREAWILRSDKIVSKVMLHRYARLYEDKLEIFHIKEKESPELEQVLPLRGCSLRDVHTSEVDVKPRGANLFLGYVSGDIKARTVVRVVDYVACDPCASAAGRRCRPMEQHVAARTWPLLVLIVDRPAP